MIVVIQCAARKQPNAGMMKTRDGQGVCFVANPHRAPQDGVQYANPDDKSDSGESWRDQLWAYNQQASSNPLGLLPAYRLYSAPVYGELVKRFGIDNVYILSAGWGLISAAFLTPLYDITFTAQADPYKRRRKSDPYSDFCMLPADTEEPIVFIGAKAYAPLFSDLTQAIAAPRTVFYRSTDRPDLPNCALVKFYTKRRTNWQYACAEALLQGSIKI